MGLESVTPHSLPPRQVPNVAAGPVHDLVAAIGAFITGDERPGSSTARPLSQVSDEVLVLQVQVKRLQAALLERLSEFDASDGARPDLADTG